jgi:hypothetical protein
MYEPGLDRHEWESQWQALEDDLRTDPAHALPEREIVAEYLAGHEVVDAVERDSDEVSPGDVAAAINGYRAVFEHLVATRASTDAQLDAADAEET